MVKEVEEEVWKQAKAIQEHHPLGSRSRTFSNMLQEDSLKIMQIDGSSWLSLKDLLNERLNVTERWEHMAQ